MPVPTPVDILSHSMRLSGVCAGRVGAHAPNYLKPFSEFLGKPDPEPNLFPLRVAALEAAVEVMAVKDPSLGHPGHHCYPDNVVVRAREFHEQMLAHPSLNPAGPPTLADRLADRRPGLARDYGFDF